MRRPLAATPADALRRWVARPFRATMVPAWATGRLLPWQPIRTVAAWRVTKEPRGVPRLAAAKVNGGPPHCVSRASLSRSTSGGGSQMIRFALRVGGALALAGTALAVPAQDFPTKPITVIVP